MLANTHYGQDAESPWRFSLADLLLWTVLAGAYFGVLAAFAVVPESFDDNAPPPAGVAATASACWVFLLAYYVRRRRLSAALLHVTPLILLLVLFLFVRDVLYPRGATLALAAGVGGAAFSLPFHLAKAVSDAGLAQAPIRTKLWVNLLGGILLTALLLAVIPSIAMRVVFTPGIVFGALLGFWLGLYQATATTPALAQTRVLGFSVRALAVGGFVGGLLGPIVHWTINFYGFGYISLPMRYTPLYGVAMAMLVAACSAWRKESRGRDTARFSREGMPIRLGGSRSRTFCYGRCWRAHISGCWRRSPPCRAH